MRCHRTAFSGPDASQVLMSITYPPPDPEAPRVESCAGCTSSSKTVEMSAGSEDTSLMVEYSVARPCSVVRSILRTASFVVVMRSWGTGGINSDIFQEYCDHPDRKTVAPRLLETPP